MQTRRTFLQQSALVGGMLPFATHLDAFTPSTSWKEQKLEVHVFSKHLQFLDYQDMAKAVADIGLDGVDLTVRRNGHVLPENAKKDLPRAVEAVKAQGLLCKMMATNINTVNDQSKIVLETAAGLGIQYYRMDYYRYPKQGSLPEALKGFSKQMKELAEFNKSLDIQATYQNHAGNYVGAAMWEVWHLLEGTPKEAAGSQYDIRHAMVEGGASWQTGLRLLKDRINTIVLKDFRWEKIDGKWTILNTPLGEGMVDFPAYFKLLKEYEIQVPVTLHLEYDLGGAEHGHRDVDADGRKRVYEAIHKDLEQAQKWWKEA